MGIRRGIDVEKGVHLPFTLVFVVEVVGVDFGGLETAREAVEGGGCCVGVRGVGWGLEGGGGGCGGGGGLRIPGGGVVGALEGCVY